MTFLSEFDVQYPLSQKLNVLRCLSQIRQLRNLNDGSVNVVTKGRQRFRICKAWTEADGAVCGVLLGTSNLVSTIYRVEEGAKIEH